MPELTAEVSRGDHTRGRAGLDHEHRPLPGRLGAEDAAARLHHEQLRLDPSLGQPSFDPLEVALDDGPDHRVDHRRGRAQVLAELGRDLGRQRDRHARQLLGQDRADPLLVRRVDVRVEQADRDRLHALAAKQRRSVANRVVVERGEHLARRAEPLDHADRAVARDERHRLLELRVVERRPHLARDLEQVAEPVGRDEAAARDLALDDRVRRDRRRVEDEADLRRGRLAVGERPLDRVHEALGRVGRRREHLRDRDPPGLLVDQGGIGERAADVDGETNAHTRSSAGKAGASALCEPPSSLRLMRVAPRLLHGRPVRR